MQKPSRRLWIGEKNYFDSYLSVSAKIALFMKQLFVQISLKITKLIFFVYQYIFSSCCQTYDVFLFFFFLFRRKEIFDWNNRVRLQQFSLFNRTQ